MFFDDQNWKALQRAAERLAAIEASMEKTVEFLNSPTVRQQVNFLNSPAVRRNIDLINSIEPILQQLLHQSSIFMDPLIQRYIERLQTDLAREPDEHEVLAHPEAELILPEIRERIVTYSPSLLLLEQLRMRRISLHDLNWRQFEEIVAELLCQNGYEVELGPGTKDGGKDIVAVKDVLGCGLIMSVWQAKKLKVGNKVDLKVIRELADTRNELNASKGVIVTTTSLTKDALKRIQQDCYLLHKVDGDDLLSWIRKT